MIIRPLEQLLGVTVCYLVERRYPSAHWVDIKTASNLPHNHSSHSKARL